VRDEGPEVPVREENPTSLPVHDEGPKVPLHDEGPKVPVHEGADPGVPQGRPGGFEGGHRGAGEAEGVVGGGVARGHCEGPGDFDAPGAAGLERVPQVEGRPAVPRQRGTLPVHPGLVHLGGEGQEQGQGVGVGVGRGVGSTLSGDACCSCSLRRGEEGGWTLVCRRCVPPGWGQAQEAAARGGAAGMGR